MTSAAHAKAMARWRAHLNAPPTPRTKKSAVGTSHDALEALSTLLLVILVLVGCGYIGVTTSRETERLVQEHREMLKAQEAAELEILQLMR